MDQSLVLRGRGLITVAVLPGRLLPISSAIASPVL